MTAPAPNPRAWAVATALAGESGLGWGRWANGSSDLEERRGLAYAEEVKRCHAVGYSNELADAFAEAASDEVEPLPPVPAPWDADAYRADAARRGVEPGPMPSLHGRTVNGLDWCVFDNAIEFRSGTVKWFMRGDELQVTHTVVPITREQWVEIGILATAAKRAMGT